MTQVTFYGGYYYDSIEESTKISHVIVVREDANNPEQLQKIFETRRNSSYVFRIIDENWINVCIDEERVVDEKEYLLQCPQVDSQTNNVFS